MSTATAQPSKPARPTAPWLDFIPAELKARTQWVVWKYELRDRKWTKVPYQPLGPKRNAKADVPSTWSSFDEAWKTYRAGGFDGIGYEFSRDDPYFGVDIDNCMRDGELLDWALPHIEMMATSYGEISPSGNGQKFIARGKLPEDTGARRKGFGPDGTGALELYDHGRFFTITGDICAATSIVDLSDSAVKLYRVAKPEAKHEKGTQSAGNGQSSPPVDASDEELLDKARSASNGAAFKALYDDGDINPYNNDNSGAHIALMNMLAFWTGKDSARMERLFSGSKLAEHEKWKRPDYRKRTIARAIRDCQKVYTPGFKPSTNGTGHQDSAANGTGHQAAADPYSKETASDGGNGQPRKIEVNYAGDDPHKLGRIFLSKRCLHNGRRTLVYHRDEFFVWENSAYRSMASHEVNAGTSEIARKEFDQLNKYAIEKWEEAGRKDKKGKECDEPVARKVGTRLLGDISSALKSETILSGRVDPPVWLRDNAPFPSEDVLPALNALVHLPSFVEGKPGAIVKPTPDFFCPYALDYGFDPKAGEPSNWLNFLDSVWNTDGESILCLHEWLGYLLTLDKSQHKMAMLIGPPRSGRGTICRLSKKLIGVSNVASPTLSGLATQFGAECLIGKPLAIIGDARQSSRSDWAVALERILGITGDDSMTIDRKNRAAWTGSLTTRLMLVSNDLPQFPDHSGAIATRPLVFKFTESFLGKEDRSLDAKLQAELPGILLLAIEGWKRLRKRGHFLQPQAGKDLVDQMRDLSSPVGAFVRERCEVKAGNVIPRDLLFQAWKNWCVDRNREPGSAATFGRNLRSVCPHLGMTQPRDKKGEKYHAYDGIDLLVMPVP